MAFMARRTQVPVVLALCAAIMLLAINTLTHTNMLAPANRPQAPSAASGTYGPSLDGANELLHSLAADMDQVQAHLQRAERALRGETERTEPARAIERSVEPVRTTLASPPPPRLSPPPPLLSPPPPAASVVVQKRATPGCHPDCSKHGTCNAELDRCDCPPFFGGDDCTTPLFPSCVKQWGLTPPVAVCGIHTQPAFPSSCDCVWECHQLALDARQECVVENTPGQTMAAALRFNKERMGWMPMIANETWLARTRADAQRTLSEKLCSGNGIHSVQLPYDFCAPAKHPVRTTPPRPLLTLVLVVLLRSDPPDGEVQNGIRLRHTPLCRCFPGYSGTNCEIKMDSASHLHKCFNNCNRRGTCVQNFCRCQPGYWGIDCSLGGGSSVTSGSSSAGTLRPRIYVYDVPPRFTSWLGAMRRGDWTRDHWYGVDVIMHQQLLRSPYRTLDPEQADFFFIPLHLSLGFYSHRYYFKHFTTPAVKPLRDVIAYVKKTWPYFDRKGGRDHMMVMTQDQGNRFVRQSVPEASPLILIHHWGAPRNVIVDNSAQGDHRLGHDITVPPFHGEQVRLNRWLPPKVKGDIRDARCADAGSPACVQPEIRPELLRRAPAESDFRQLLFFSGKMNLNWGRAYALGVRQAIYRAHRNDSRLLIMTFDNGVKEKVPFEKHVANYAESKFCLAPAGYGFSSRQYECVLVGCVPIIIQDDVEMAFEEVLPWRRFGLRLNFSDIPILPQILAKVPARHVARLRRGLGCIWPRMLWLTQGLYSNRAIDTEPITTAARPHDAFETTMRTLRGRLLGSTGSRDHVGVRTDEGWRAAVDSCVVEAGDEEELDLDALRKQVRDEKVPLRASAKIVEEIIQQWQTSKDDKTFAMRTRFFPSGVKIPGVKWTD